MSGVCNWTVWSAKTLSNSQIILLLISIPSKSISHTTSELIPPETHFWSCHLLLENIPHCFSFADKSITWSPSKNQCLPWGIPTGLIFFFFGLIFTPSSSLPCIPDRLSDALYQTQLTRHPKSAHLLSDWNGPRGILHCPQGHGTRSLLLPLWHHYRLRSPDWQGETGTQLPWPDWTHEAYTFRVAKRAAGTIQQCRDFNFPKCEMSVVQMSMVQWYHG